MVSILLLSWNHERYIVQSLNSLIDQAYKDIEIIYLDNCSADATYTIAVDIMEKSGIKYQAYRREVPHGITQNQNFLFSKSSGEFISMCSGDDWLNRESIAIKMKYMDEKDVGMVYSDGYKYYDDIDVYEPFVGEHFENEMVLDEMFKRNFISALGCIIRRSVIETVGSWDEYLIVEDTDMWLRIAAKYRIVHLKEKLFYYRKHASAISSDYEHMYRAKLQIYEKYKRVNPHNKLLLDNARKNYISSRVMNDTSFGTFREVIKNYKPNTFYTKLLLKSVIPVRWKKWYFKRGLIKKWK